MKILVVGHSYVVDSNRQFWNQFASDSGAKVDLVTPREWNSNLIKKLEYKFNQNTDGNLASIYPVDCYFRGNGSLYFYKWSQLSKIIFSNQYDLIFVFQETWSFSTAQMSLLKFLSKNRRSLYYLAVCQNIIKKRLFWLIPFERVITGSVDRILYCTKEIIEVLNWKKIKNPKSFFPFSYDHNIYNFQLKERKKIINIGYMGRLTNEKGIDCLIEACRKLKSENYDIKLYLAGSGPLRDQCKEDFVQYAGPFKHTEAHHFYNQIDIFILPSETRKFWKEQFGRVIVESIASGTPVIGSSSGAIPEVLALLGMDYIFQESNSEDLIRVFKNLLLDMDSENFNQKLVNANNLNLKKFSHTGVAKNLILMINDDIEKKLPCV